VTTVLGSSSTGRGIVHLGAGGFARSLPWWATALAVDAEPGPWSITAVAHRSRDVVAALRAHDWRYDVTFLGPGTERTDRVGIVAGGLVTVDDPGAVVAELAAAHTRVVTVTATEAAYVADDALEADLAGRQPLTVVGQLVAAAERRLADGAPALSVVSCDNVASGSTVLRRLAVDAAAGRGLDDVAAELEGRWSWPLSVVDRVVPTVTPADQPDVVADAWWRWVLADDFAGPRPGWEHAGVQLVDDAEPWQHAKLLLVNAPHSLLALLGLTRGHQFVSEAMADSLVRRAVEALLSELVPCVPTAPGLDPDAEAVLTVERFAEQVVRHPLAQVAAEGSTKLPQRLRRPLDHQRSTGGDACWSTLAIALWVRAVDRGEAADRDVDEVRATAGRPATARAAAVIDLLGLASDHDDDPVRDQLAVWLARLVDHDDAGVHRAVTDRLG